MSEVRKRKRQFEIGFKRQVVQEVESGSISLSAAGRKYEISPGLINQWRDKFRCGAPHDVPSKREREMEKELERYKVLLAEAHADREFFMTCWLQNLCTLVQCPRVANPQFQGVLSSHSTLQKTDRNASTTADEKLGNTTVSNSCLISNDGSAFALGIINRYSSAIPIISATRLILLTRSLLLNPFLPRRS